MNEASRMQYLDVLGIDSYMPRRILPGAPRPGACAASPAFQPLPATVSNLVSAVDFRSAGASPRPDQSRRESDEAARSVVAQPVETGDVAGQPVEEQVEPMGPEGVAEPRFSLGLWLLEGSLLVIDSRQPQAALPTQSLLANLVFAVGYRQPLPPAEVFNWPLLKVPETNSEPAARDTITAMLEARMESLQIRHCLLLGAAAIYYCADPDYLFALSAYSGGPDAVLNAVQGKAVPVAGLSVSAIALPSLTQMLSTPGYKADAWRAVHVIRKQ